MLACDYGACRSCHRTGACALALYKVLGEIVKAALVYEERLALLFKVA